MEEEFYEMLCKIAETSFRGEWYHTWFYMMKAEIQHLEDIGKNGAEILAWVKEKIEEEIEGIEDSCDRGEGQKEKMK